MMTTRGGGGHHHHDDDDDDVEDDDDDDDASEHANQTHPPQARSVHHHHFNRIPPPPSSAEEGGGREWRNALFECNDGLAIVFAAFCPCVYLVDVANHMYDDGEDGHSPHHRHHPHYYYQHQPSRVRNGLVVVQMNSVYACLLSCLVDLPVLFCADQFIARATGRNAPDSNEMEGGEDTTPSASLSMFAPAALFGNGNAASSSSDGWARDGKDWDLEEDASEDWWPASWCLHYARRACLGMCWQGRCAYNSTTARLPLCFSLLACALYPCAVCPTACMLRNVVAARHDIREPCHRTCCIVGGCAPCAIVQLLREVE